MLSLALALLFGAVPAGSATSAANASSFEASTPSQFAARVLRGKLIEASTTGPAYQKTLWSQLDGPTTAALKRCIVQHAPADKSPFTLVADVPHDGKPVAVEVQPATPLATCFAVWFRTATLPAPPALADSTAYPIEIDVSITP